MKRLFAQLREKDRVRPHSRRGFTLIEIMMTVLVIALLAALAFPAFSKARRRTQIVATANNIRKFADAFDLYAMERAGFPPDCHLDAPWHLPNVEMEGYLDREQWKEETPLGGNYNWEGPDGYPYAGIAIFGSTASADVFRELDSLLDNGDLTSGIFRQTPNGRYTYIIEE